MQLLDEPKPGEYEKSILSIGHHCETEPDPPMHARNVIEVEYVYRPSVCECQRYKNIQTGNKVYTPAMNPAGYYPLATSGTSNAVPAE